MKNIIIQVKNILNIIKIKIINIMLSIGKIIAHIIYMIVILIAYISYIMWTIIFLIKNKSMLKLKVISLIYTIKYKVVSFIKNIINKIKNKNKMLFIYFSTLYNNKLTLLKSRLNQDCLGKRLFRNMQNTINFKLYRDIIPLITLLITKFSLIYMLYMSILDLIVLQYS